MCVDSTSVSQPWLWELARGGTPPATVALPAHGAIRLHPTWEQVPGSSSSASLQPLGTVAQLQPRAGAARLPCQHASIPACPLHRPLHHRGTANVSQQWGPIRNEMFLLGHFICTLQ